MGVAGAAGKVGELQSVQRGMEFIGSKAKAIKESERVAQSVDYVKKKAEELSENERVKRLSEVAGTSVEAAKAGAAAAAEKANQAKDMAKEKAAQGIEYAIDKTRAVREGAGNIWSAGRGSISRVKASVSSGAWRGSARDTLDIAARDEQWKDIKVQGAEEMTVPARREHTSCYHVAKGSTLRWTFRVKEHDIGFGVRMRVQEFGGAREEEVLACERYDNADTISGSWVADEDRTMVLCFDNTYSKLRGKTVAYLVGTEKRSAFLGPVTEDSATATSSAVPPAEPASEAQAATNAVSANASLSG